MAAAKRKKDDSQEKLITVKIQTHHTAVKEKYSQFCRLDGSATSIDILYPAKSTPAPKGPGWKYDEISVPVLIQSVILCLMYRMMKDGLSNEKGL